MCAEAARLLKIAKTQSTAVADLSRQPVSTRNMVVAAQETALKAQAKALDLHEELERKTAELATLATVQRQSQQALREAESLSSVLSTW